MKAFARMFVGLDSSNKTNAKLAVLSDYFKQVPSADGAWAVFFLGGRKLNRLLKLANLRDWGSSAAGVPPWLFDECYHAVGDLAETLSLLLPRPEDASDIPLHQWVEESLQALANLDDAGQKQIVLRAWKLMDADQRLVWNKLITGSFRVGVSQRLVVRALAEAAGLDPALIAHRLMGDWQPTAEFYQSLLDPDSTRDDVGRPYPFFLAHPLEEDPQTLGALADWQFEWKWDGIRAQLLRRQGTLYLWSRGEDLVTERFPEIITEAARLPDGTVLDGEILAWRGDAVQPFAELQKRIGRKNLTRRVLEDVPVSFLTFDLLEWQGQDVRGVPLAERRRILETLLPPGWGQAIRLSPVVEASSWQELAERRLESRTRNVEGLLMKRRDSTYGVGRVRGPWWKWKIHPYSVDAVMIYAQLGHGKRASLYTDYTFAVWHEGELVPFAKAYSGLTDEEIREVDRWVRRNTTERFGPVRQVKPELVFELAFEGIQRSSRHKSGIAVRFPRIARWRQDKTPTDADTLETLRNLAKLREPKTPPAQLELFADQE